MAERKTCGTCYYLNLWFCGIKGRCACSRSDNCGLVMYTHQSCDCHKE